MATSPTHPSSGIKGTLRWADRPTGPLRALPALLPPEAVRRGGGTSDLMGTKPRSVSSALPVGMASLVWGSWEEGRRGGL